MAFDELKTHLHGRQMLLRSKTPDIIRQEFYGLVMAYYAIRDLMHEAALQAEVDPDRLSFIHAVRVVRRGPALAPYRTVHPGSLYHDPARRPGTRVRVSQWCWRKSESS
jgi:hypothetical protein